MASFQDIADDFLFIEDWEERFRYLIDLGRALAPLDDSERTPENKVHGCASQVWLITEPADAHGRLRFRGDSDAILVKGIIAVVLALYDGRTPAEIVALDADAALGALGLKDQLTLQRSNGLMSMIARIRQEAARRA